MIRRRYSSLESSTIMGKAPKKLMGPNINILLWNVFKCQKKGWHKDFVTLTNDKDLILLQEAVLNSPFDSHFNTSLQHQWIMARSFKNVRTNIDTGVKTGSTVAATEHYFSASTHGEPFSKTKKMLLATVYPLIPQGPPLLVVNSHLINFVSFGKFKTHLEQVFQTLNDHEGPAILAGDFNTWNVKRLQHFQYLAEEFALTEVVLRRQPKLSHLFRHLDHVYYRGLEVVDANVHTEIRSSDHYPISLSFRTTDSA